MSNLTTDSLCNTYLNSIEDPIMQEISKEFLVYLDSEKTLACGKSSARKFLVHVRYVKFNELNLTKFHEFCLAEINSSPSRSYARALRLFFCYLVKFNKYPIEYSEDIKKVFSRKEYEEFLDVLLFQKFIPYKQVADFFDAVNNSKPFTQEVDPILNSLNKFKDLELQMVVRDFLEYAEQNNLSINSTSLPKFLIVLRNLSMLELTPQKFLELCRIELKSRKDYCCIKALRMFFAYLVKFKRYSTSNKTSYENIEVRNKLSKMYFKFIDALLNKQSIKQEKVIDFLTFITESQLFLIHSYDQGPSTVWQLIALNTSNKLIIKLLSEFCENNSFNESYDERFFTHFIDSCKEIEGFTSITDFNYSIFKKQFEFFSPISKYCRRYVSTFYLHLLTYPDGENIFKIGDPIDKNMLQRTDFAELYSSGHTLVLYNKMEASPTIDKWVICPNGHEYKSTRMRPNKYFAIDFSRIENAFYRQIAKEYLWVHDSNLATAVSQVSSHLTRTLNFISNFKKIYIKNPQDEVMYNQIVAADVYTWRSNLLLNCKSPKTLSEHYSVLKGFLTLGKDKSYLSVQNLCFEYLKTKNPRRYDGGESIPDKALFSLQSKMLDIVDESFENFLYFVLLHLLVETNIRVSQLLNLKISEIEEGMKEGQFMICTNTKLSNGEIEQDHISPYAKRLLDKAISHTENLRTECTDPLLKDCIFLTQSRRKYKNQIHIITINAFNRFLKRQCAELGFQNFSSGNLRDTHMTKAREFVKKNNLSRVQESILTGHANIDTTNKHYIDKDIRTFIEATHGVIIGDVDIKGNILNQINTTFDQSSEVEDRCGFCKEDTCIALHPLLNCLLCDGIVVTLDRIPFFESKIEELDGKISKESIQHEKEHLYTLKRLFSAYLARLYTLKENFKND